MEKLVKKTSLICVVLWTAFSCRMGNRDISPEAIQSINLKRGELVGCGPTDKQFGTLNFETTCSEKVKNQFNLAVSLLHSFEYDEAEKVFAGIIDTEPRCAMAYWGVAMCNFHPLWAPSTPAELAKGLKAIDIARSLEPLTQRETDYIEAIAQFYLDADKVNHHDRCVRFAKAMESMYRKYPQDKEAAIFYALAIDAAVDPNDKTFAGQKKAGAILNSIYPNDPNHPGIIHYIIHTYDYPGLAEQGLDAARKYASVAPSSAHAQHMPSHIFTRLGLWDECIRSNTMSVASAKCYAENAGIKGHWDEELHGLDYLVYAYLQKAEDSLAKEQCNYLKTMDTVYPEDFKVAYAFAAIPARYILEKRMWAEASNLESHPISFPWGKFPWQKAIFHFTRSLGYAHLGKIDSARAELEKLKLLHNILVNEKDLYKANLVEIQVNASEAWILYRNGNLDKALELMHAAADMEDATQKHPVTPGEIIPARELLGDMLLDKGNAKEALIAYLEDLKLHPNRFNGLYGAALAAEKSGSTERARYFYQQLSDIGSTNANRPGLVAARRFLKAHPLTVRSSPSQAGSNK